MDKYRDELRKRREIVMQRIEVGDSPKSIMLDTGVSYATFEKLRQVVQVQKPNTKQILKVVSLIVDTHMTYADIAAKVQTTLGNVKHIRECLTDLGWDYPPRKVGRPRKDA